MGGKDCTMHPHPHRLIRPRALLALLGIAGLAIGRPAPAQDFQPGCTLPFDGIKETHPIDHLCPRARGNVPDPPVAGNDAAHALQNERKNNFCATGGPALVTFFSFKKLQQKLDQKTPDAKHWTRTNLPADRSVLSDVYSTSGGDTIGEGSVVRFAAWVMMLRGNSVESCNCETSGKNEIDVPALGEAERLSAAGRGSRGVAPPKQRSENMRTRHHPTPKEA